MTHTFDKAYWETHWNSAHEGAMPPHPALDTEISPIPPGAALEAGSGEGAEALWLAAHGWDVTAVDISPEALRRAADQAPAGARPVNWVEGDLTTWEPTRTYDLVTTFYAHPTIPQLALYQRISRWVTPGGTLLIVGHAQHHERHDDHGQHPQHATTTPELIRTTLGDPEWNVQTAEIRQRTLGGTALVDVIVQARRRP